jgi:hypothetical protein
VDIQAELAELTQPSPWWFSSDCTRLLGLGSCTLLLEVKQQQVLLPHLREVRVTVLRDRAPSLTCSFASLEGSRKRPLLRLRKLLRGLCPCWGAAR